MIRRAQETPPPLLSCSILDPPGGALRWGSQGTTSQVPAPNGRTETMYGRGAEDGRRHAVFG